MKPQNLLFDERGRLVVADLGIARAAFESRLTTSGELLGTAAYMAPEQVDGDPGRPASDRYSLAVVAFELLTGGLPFAGGTLMELAVRRTQMDPPPGEWALRRSARGTWTTCLPRGPGAGIRTQRWDQRDQVRHRALGGGG